MDARAGRRVFLDVGGHVGESLSVAMQPRWRFERIWTFEPTASCAVELEKMSDRRVTVVPAGWWSSDAEMDVHDPGTIHASVLPEASDFRQVARCKWLQARVTEFRYHTGVRNRAKGRPLRHRILRRYPRGFCVTRNFSRDRSMT